MLVSFNQLHDYIHFNFSPEYIAEKLTMIGFEVESVFRFGQVFEDVFAARIIGVRRYKKNVYFNIYKLDLNEKVKEVICKNINCDIGDIIVYTEKNISLNPAEQWSDLTEYEKASKNLLLLFKNNLVKMNLPKNSVIEKGSIFSSK